MVIRYVGHGVEVPGESVGGDVCSVGIAGVCAGYVGVGMDKELVGMVGDSKMGVLVEVGKIGVAAAGKCCRGALAAVDCCSIGAGYLGLWFGCSVG